MIEPTTKTRRAKRGTAKLPAEKPFMLNEISMVDHPGTGRITKVADEAPAATKRGRPRAAAMTEAERHAAAVRRLKAQHGEREQMIAASFENRIAWYDRNKAELEEAVATKEAFLIEALKRVANFEMLEHKVDRQAEEIVDLREIIDRTAQHVVQARAAAAAMRQTAFPRGPQFPWEND